MSLINRQGKIWLNGHFLDWQDSQTHILTHTLHYGLGIFEGLRAYQTPKGPAIFRLSDHTKRLYTSANVTHIDIPYSQAEFNDIQKAVIRVNELENAYIRPILFHGAETLNLSTQATTLNTAVAAWHWADYHDPNHKTQGIHIGQVSIVRSQDNPALCQTKATGHYVFSILAINEAQKNGFDEALMLDAHGYIAEGSAENIFIIKDKTLYTPTLACALGGITRDTIITLAKDLDLTVQECNLTPQDLIQADEAFLTGTAVEVVPIRAFNHTPIGNATPGPLTQTLKTLYREVVSGAHSKYTDWLAYV